MSAPDHITEFVCEDCGDHCARLRSLLRLTGALDVPASSANIRHASRGICEATLSRVAKRRKAAAHDAVIPARTHGRRRWTMDDETLRYCVATVPFALKLFFGLYPESCRFRIYVAWSLLLTPPVQTTGDAPTPANAFIAGQ